MARTVQAGTLRLGQGRPKVCVPLSGETREDMMKAFQAAMLHGADMVEVRLDSMFPEPDSQGAVAFMDYLPSALPRLCTFRTVREGGAGVGSPAAQAAMFETVLPFSELIDAEISHPLYGEMCQMARKARVPVVASLHDFEKTPEKAYLLERFQAAGDADILKFACMPQCPEDVLRVMETALEAKARFDRPIIAIAMGKLGVISRIGAQLFGSCLTFGAAGRQSAPGQPYSEMLLEVTKLIYKEMKE